MDSASTAATLLPDGRRRLLRPLALLAAIRLGAIPVTADDTFVVDSFLDQVDADLVDVYCLTAAGTCTLRAAVMQANVNPGNTTILLPAGLFSLSRLPSGGNGADSGDLNLAKAGPATITIRGSSARTTLVDGGDLDRIFRVASGSLARISDLTVRNGRALNGGGILVQGELLLFNARVAENESTAHGGGLYVDTPARFYADYTDVEANVSQGNGGGLYFSVNADGSYYGFGYGAIRDNVSMAAGGGLYLLGPAGFSLYFASVSGNRAGIAGGLAFSAHTAEVVVAWSAIHANRATDGELGAGGGIWNDSTLSVVNSTISGNSSTGDGGGLFNAWNATLYSSTVAFNDADSDADINGGRGGGVFSAPSGTFAIRNSVFAGNFRSGAPVPDDCFGDLGAYGHNRFGSFDGCAVTHTGGCGGSDLPLGSVAELGPLRYNGGETPTHEIVAGSGLVDDVDPPCTCQNQLANPIPIDQRRGPRVVGLRCDVGAYELGALPPKIVFADDFELGHTGLWD